MTRTRRRTSETTAAAAVLSLLLCAIPSRAQGPDAILRMLEEGRRDAALSAMVGAQKAVEAQPDRLGRRLFEFREKEILEATGAVEEYDRALEEIAAGGLDDAAKRLLRAIETRPLAWPLHDLLAVLHLAGSRAAVEGVEPRLTAPMRLLFGAARDAEAGQTARSRAQVDTLLREHRDFLPACKTLGMFPDTVVDFREKAEFGRRYLREGAGAVHAALSHLLFENALVSALEAAQACRRARIELSAEASLLFDERGALRGDLSDERRQRLRCPAGVPFRVEPSGGAPALFCPLHGR